MKHPIRTRILALSLCLGLLSGCGEAAVSSVEQPASAEPTSALPSAAAVPQTTASPKEQTGYGYEVEWEKLELEGMTAENLLQVGDRLFLEVSFDTGGKGAYDLTEKELLPTEDLGEILTVTAAGESLYYCVSEDTGLNLVQVSPEDGSVQETAELQDSSSVYPYSVAVDGDGNSYLLTASGILIYSPKGKQISLFSLAEGERGVALTRLSSGEVLLATQTKTTDGTEGAVKRLNTESIGATLTEKQVVYRAYPGWDGKALLWGGGSLYVLDTENTVMEAVLDWIDTDVNPDALASVVSGEQETIYLLSTSQSGASLGTLHRVEAEQESRTVINLGYYTTDTALSTAINTLAVSYNTSQEDTRVHLVNYASYSDGKTRLVADSADLDLVLAEQETLSAMELTDLSKLFDDEVGTETLLSAVSDGLTASGATGMPLYVTAETLIGTKTVLGETRGWTPAQFAETVAAHSGAAVLQYCTAYDALDMILGAAGEYITDYPSLLTAMKGLPAGDDTLNNYPANLATGSVESLKNGTLLLTPVTITGFADLLTWQAALGDELVLRGYPTDEGNGTVLHASNALLAIPGASSHKTEAWEFLKQILTAEETEQYRQSGGFPVLEQAYQQAEEDAMSGLVYQSDSGETVSTGGQATLDGVAYELSPLTEAGAEDFRSLLEGACGFAGGTQSLRDSARAALKSVLESGTEPAAAAKTIQAE